MSKQKRKQLEGEQSQKSNILPQIVGRNNKLESLPSLNQHEGRSEGMKTNELAHRRNGAERMVPYLDKAELSKKELGSVPAYKYLDRSSKSRYSCNGLPTEKVAEQGDSKPLIASDNEQEKPSISKKKVNKKTASNKINLDSSVTEIGRAGINKGIRSPSCLTHAPLADDRLIKNVRSQQ